MYFGMKPAASVPLSLQKVQPVDVVASDILETANWTTQMNRAVCVVYQEFDAHLKTSTLKNDAFIHENTGALMPTRMRRSRNFFYLKV